MEQLLEKLKKVNNSIVAIEDETVLCDIQLSHIELNNLIHYLEAIITLTKTI